MELKKKNNKTSLHYIGMYSKVTDIFLAIYSTYVVKILYTFFNIL